MSEHGKTKPTEFGDLTWGEGGDPNPHSKPSAGRREDGWLETGLHPGDEENWLDREMSRALQWLAVAYPREFATLAEAIPEILDSYMFRVHAPASNWRQRGATIFNTQGTGGAVAVVGVATDGQRIYYGQSDYCYATSPASLTDEWSYQPSSGKNVIDIAADGLRVYVLIETLTPGDEVSLLDPSDGSKETGLDITTPSCTCLDANGTFLVVAQTGTVHFYNNLTGTPPTKTGTFNNTQTIIRLCIGNRRVYTLAAQGTGYPIIRAVDLVARTEDWNNGSWGASAPFDANWICTDSDRVYVVSDRATLSSGYANVWAFSAQTGALLWAADLGSGLDPDSCTVDDRLLYVGEPGNEETWVLDKRDGFVLWKTADIRALACDGLSWCGTNFLNNVRRHWRGGPSRIFLRCNGADDERRPFFNLAVPIGEGL